MNFYLIIGSDLVIKDANGVELWKGKPEGVEVAWATSIPDSSDGLALYEPYPDDWQRITGSQNLIRVSPSGQIVWRAELPEKGSKYVGAKLLSRDRLRAYAPSYDVDLDLETGKIRKQVWTK